MKQNHKYAVELVKQLIAKMSKGSSGSNYIKDEGYHSDNLKSGPLGNKSKVMPVEISIEDLNRNCETSGKNEIMDVHVFLSKAKKLGIVKCIKAVNDEKSSRTIEDPLFLATKFGIVEIVGIILKEFPEAVESCDENGKNILHLAAEYRQDAVFEFLFSDKKISLTKMVADVDKEKNTPLHLAAKLGDHRPMNVRGALRQLPWEILWFKRFKSITQSQPHLLRLKNSECKTADDLFKETHEDTELSETAEKWTKDTANNLMIVGTLVCTIAITAAFSIPGDFDDKSGVARLVHATGFREFLVYLGATALCTLFTLGVSYSANLSCFDLEEYYIALPMKYIIASWSFFLSVIFTMATFSEALILATDGDFKPTFALVYTGTFMILIYIDLVLPAIQYIASVLMYVRNRGH